MLLMSELDRTIIFTRHEAFDGTFYLTVDGFPPEIDVNEELLKDADERWFTYDGELLTIKAQNGTGQYKRQLETAENRSASLVGCVRFTRLSGVLNEQRA